jgi:hypothetical protein
MEKLELTKLQSKQKEGWEILEKIVRKAIRNDGSVDELSLKLKEQLTTLTSQVVDFGSQILVLKKKLETVTTKFHQLEEIMQNHTELIATNDANAGKKIETFMKFYLCRPIKFGKFMFKQKKLFKFSLKRNFQFNCQNYSIELKNLEKEPLEKQPPLKIKKVFNIVETAKIEVKSHPIVILLSIVAMIVAIFFNIPWSAKFSLKLLSKEYVPSEMPKQYFTRKKIEQDIHKLLNQSQLIIIYGPKISGKTTTINKVLEGRKGVIPVSYEKGKNLLVELGSFLEIPTEKISSLTIKKIFQEFKKVYGTFPIVSIDINGEYDVSMEQWVRKGRHLTEDGKGVCDCIIQFSYEDAALAGLVERQRSNYIRFGDLSKQEAIEFLKMFNQPEPEKILKEIKTTRVGDLEKVVNGKKDEFLLSRDVDMEFVFNNQKYIEILKEIDEGKLKKVHEVMKKLGIEETKEKEFFQHPFFTKKVLIVNLKDFTVSIDSEFIKDQIKNFKK